MLSIVVFVAIMLAVFVPVDIAVTHFAPEFRRHRVDDRKIPDHFPLLVIQTSGAGSEHKAVIVEYAGLKEYLRSVGSYSFLVPMGDVREPNRQVAERKDPFGHSRNNWFEVKPLPNGRQRITVRGGDTMEDRVTGWYTANAHTFEPEYYQSYYSGKKLIYEMPYVLVTACFVWYITWRLARFQSRRQITSIPTQE